MNRYKLYQPGKFCNYLRSKNQPFLLEQTMLTKKIFTDGCCYEYSDKSELKKTDLGFIGSVKNYCEKNSPVISVDRSKINYIQNSFNMPLNYSFKKDLYEIDLSGAYWEYANLIPGVFSESLYKKGLEQKKFVRLIALGNLAKRTALINFDGYKYLPIEFRRSEQTEGIFFKASESVDLLMRNLIVLANQNFLFYWCDAIFVNSVYAMNLICEFLLDNQIKFKIQQIDFIERRKEKIITYDKAHIKENNLAGERAFNFRKSKFLQISYSNG